MKQKDIFLRSEGDAWFARNHQAVATRKLPEDDPILCELLDFLPSNFGAKLKVLEIGCGEGTRLEWIRNNLNADCYGVEPSAQAVKVACAKGINAHQGTADALPFESGSFDIVIFGFCLYLCDRDDLFLISAEANRVLRTSGWIMILDFFSPIPRSKTYHHLPGVQSYKMDYRSLFTWHPEYECMIHKIFGHAEGKFTDDFDEWVGISVLRKHKKEKES